jgi:inhibitor of KinA sporulation pathway (predicted exonuclease)
MITNIINVMDLELTCYEDGVFPPGERQEIIEIGLCMVDRRKLTIEKRVSIPIIPTMSRVSPFCTKLTGWTEAKLRRPGVGMSFAEACRRMANLYGATNRLLATDSNGDVRVFREQCEFMGVPCPLGEMHQNVATLFALVRRNDNNLGLEAMLAEFGLTFEGRPHCGVHDATNIARVLLKLLEQSAVPSA